MFNVEFRLKFYTGYYFINIENMDTCDKDTLIDLSHINMICLHEDKNYGIVFKNMIENTINHDKKFMIKFGDVETSITYFTFLKNRPSYETRGVILRSLNIDRHWYNYYNKPLDISFNDKINTIIWRGATTGQLNRYGNRFKLIKSWFKKDKCINIGFSLICQNKGEYKKYKLNKLSPIEMLKYKYIISVEGNDKDSGLNWKLNSNSLVFMPKPTVTSWLMETLLVPNYHYIELKDDFSDLLEKYKWCENNQDKCIEIIKNANVFMSMFNNKEQEEKLEQDVIHNYFEMIHQKSL